MSNPHMTGRKETDTQTETRSASELLDSDGKIDLNKVRSLSKRGLKSSQKKITAAQATEIRRRLLRGAGTVELADEFDVTGKTVSNHARGECDYSGEENPETPPLTYGPGGWRVADE